MSNKANQLSAIIDIMKSSYLVIKDLDKKIRLVESGEPSISQRILKKRMISDKAVFAEAAAIFLEGILAYRATKFIFDILIGIDLGEFGNSILLLLSFSLSAMIIKGCIKLAGIAKMIFEETNSVWVMFLPFSILLVLPLINILIDIENYIYISIAILSVVINFSITFLVSMSKYVSNEEFLNFELKSDEYFDAVKTKRKVLSKVHKDYKTFLFIKDDIQSNEITEFNNEIKKILSLEKKIEHDIDIDENDGFLFWWKDSFK